MKATLNQPLETVAGEEPLYEIVNGQKVEIDPNSMLSGKIASRVHNAIFQYLERNPGTGEAVIENLFKINPLISRRPDVAYISYESVSEKESNARKGDWPVAPNLAVEVVSANDLSEAVTVKVDEYLRNGVQQVWVVSPESRKILVYDNLDQVRAVRENGVLKTDLLPGFEVKAADIFPR